MNLRSFYRWEFGLGLLAVLFFSACKPTNTATTSGGEGTPRGGRTATTRPWPDPAARPELTAKYIDAATYQAQGEAARALNLYEEILTTAPNEPAAHYNVALLMREQNRMQDALPHAEQAVRLDNSNNWYHVLLADLYVNNRRFEDAAKALKKASQLFPDDDDLLFRLSDVYLKMGRFNEVLELLPVLEQRTGEYEMAARQRKELFLMMNKPDSAVAAIQSLINRYPTQNQHYYELHDLYISLHKKDSAIAVLERLYAEDPHDPVALFRLVDHYQQSNQPEKAEQYIERAFHTSAVPLDTKIRFLANLMARQQSDADGARIESLISGLYAEAPNNAIVLSLMGERFLKLEKPDSARHYFRRSLNQDPLSLPIWEELLRLDQELNLSDSLFKDAEQALTVFPNQLSFNFFIGVANVQRGNYAEAIRPLEKVIRLGGTDYELQAQAHTLLGDVYANQNDAAKAEENYKKAIALAPGNLTALNNYAFFLANRGTNLPEALRMIEKVIDRDPNNAAFQDTYGWVLFKMERYDDARRWIEKSLAANESADVAEHLGDVLFRQGNVDRAVELWQRAQNLGSNSDTLRAKIANRSL